VPIKHILLNYKKKVVAIVSFARHSSLSKRTLTRPYVSGVRAEDAGLVVQEPDLLPISQVVVDLAIAVIDHCAT
jgi:hypothetical protein